MFIINGSIGNACCQGLNCGDKCNQLYKTGTGKGQKRKSERGRTVESTQKITGDEGKAGDPKIVGQGTRASHRLQEAFALVKEDQETNK